MLGFIRDPGSALPQFLRCCGASGGSRRHLRFFIAGFVLLAIGIALFGWVVHRRGMETGLPPEEDPEYYDWAYYVPADCILVRLDYRNPHYKMIAASVAEVRKGYADNPLFGAWVRSPRELRSNALKKLCPDHKFYMFSWFEFLEDPTSQPAGVAFSFFPTRLYVVDEEGTARILSGFGGDGNVTFVELLSERGIKVKGFRDARRVWHAYATMNPMNRRFHKDSKSKRASPTEWRFAIDEAFSGNGRLLCTYYFQILLNDDLTVKSVDWVREEAQDPETSEAPDLL